MKKNRSQFVFAASGILGGLAVAIAVLLVDTDPPRQPGNPGGQQAGQMENAPEVPADTASRALIPGNNARTDTQPRSVQRMDPKLQAGVDPSKAEVFFEVNSLTEIPGFDQSVLRVKRGQIVSLTFRNRSMTNHLHNWALVVPGKALEVSAAAAQAGPEAGFIPILPNDLLAHTRMLSPGESETITFRAPDEPGAYPYICLFNGHANSMKGQLIVD